MNILDLPLGGNDANANTIREYFRTMMVELWIRGESFSGKRPLGNSGWEYPVYEALVKAGLIEGQVDENGYIIGDFDRDKAHSLVTEALKAL